MAPAGSAKLQGTLALAGFFAAAAANAEFLAFLAGFWAPTPCRSATTGKPARGVGGDLLFEHRETPTRATVNAAAAVVALAGFASCSATCCCERGPRAGSSPVGRPRLDRRGAPGSRQPRTRTRRSAATSGWSIPKPTSARCASIHRLPVGTVKTSPGCRVTGTTPAARPARFSPRSSRKTCSATGGWTHSSPPVCWKWDEGEVNSRRSIRVTRGKGATKNTGK